jgi:hypothetical protein
MTHRRRAAGDRWSATFSMTLVGTDSRRPLPAGAPDDELERLLDGVAGRVQFRFRFDGRQVNPSVPLADGVDEVIRFRDLLRVAIANDWDLVDKTPAPPAATSDRDDALAPVPEAQPPSAAGPTAANVIAFPRPAVGPGRPAPAAGHPGPVLFDVDRPRHRELADPVQPLDTFADLESWRNRHLAETNARGKGKKRLGNTLGNAEGELAFAADYFRAATTAAGIPTASRPVRGDGMIDSDDCIDFCTYRKHTNLQARSSNEKRTRDYGAAVERALREGGPVPAPPVLDAEVASVRTIEATTKTVAAALGAALVEELIDANPWTAKVTSRVESPARTHFTERSLPSPEAVARIADAIAAATRTSIVGGKRTEVTGERYRYFVEFTYWLHTRPEETRAVRDSCFVLDHPTLEPHVVLREAITMVAARFTAGGRSYEIVPLKARGEGDERRVWLTPEQARMARRHRELFVPDPDPASDDPDRRDPLWFTTHNGSIIDPSNFNANWWRPTMEALTGQLPICERLKFRHLRHAGITRRILDGEGSIDEIADDAGNTPEVIRASYRGVIDAAEHDGPRRRRASTAGTDTLDALIAGDLTPRALRERLDSLSGDQRADAECALRMVIGALSDA